MKLDDDIEFTTLSWVKHELDATVRQAQDALEAYVDDPSDLAQMRNCATHLHQVHGTLRMVELYGAAMVVEEMEQVADALLDEQVADRDDAYGALMRGMVQIPDYLERVQGGHRDIPVVLLSLLNELRAARGEQALSEAVLFSPNLNAELPAGAPGASVPIPAAEQCTIVNGLRQRFQVAMLTWMREPQAGTGLGKMREILDELGSACYSVTGRRLWWITGGVIEGLQANQLDEQRAELRPLIGRVDRAMKQLMDGGEMALARGDAEDLTRQLLYYVAHADGSSARLEALRTTYQLQHAVPDDKDVEHARGAMSGHNRALLDTVSHAIKEDLLRVKDALDLFLREADPDPAELAPQIDVLDRVADTLGMLGLAVPRRVIDEQHAVIKDIASGSRAHDEGVLLDVAGALLYVESSIDEHIEHLGVESADGDEASAPLNAEARRVLGALMAEAAINLGKVKRDITAFIETPWDHAEVEHIPRLLEEIGGAMRMLDVHRPADLLGGISRFVENELITDQRVPTAEQMDKLADALASVEYYLEAAREHRAGRERILDVAQRSLGAIGYWPVPERRAPREDLSEVEIDSLNESVSIAPGSSLEDLIIGDKQTLESNAQDLSGISFAETASTAPPEDDDEDWIEIEEQIEERVPVDSGERGFQDVSNEIDEDIREVFIEEFEEEIVALEASVAIWRADTDNRDALTPVRRSFHTLKGSGRLVGALSVGEFSWKVENMLNRVLDHSIAGDANVLALVEHAIAALPSLLAQLRGDQAAAAPIAAIMQTADKLAEGEAARVEDVPTAATRTVTRTVKRRIPRPRGAEEVPVANFAGVESQGVESQPVEPAAGAESLEIPALPVIDPVLLDILRSEVAQHMGVMRAYCETHAAETGSTTVSEPMLRAVHTLSGAVAMVDIPILGRVLAPLEAYLKRARADHGVGLPAEGRAVVAQSADLVSAVMMQFDSADPQLPDSTELAARIAAMRDELPEPEFAYTLFDSDAGSLHGADDTDAEAIPELTGPDLGTPDAAPFGATDVDESTPEQAAEADAEADASESWLAAEIEGAAASLPDLGSDAEAYRSNAWEFSSNEGPPPSADERSNFDADPEAHSMHEQVSTDAVEDGDAHGDDRARSDSEETGAVIPDTTAEIDADDEAGAVTDIIDEGGDAEPATLAETVESEPEPAESMNLAEQDEYAEQTGSVDAIEGAEPATAGTAEDGETTAEDESGEYVRVALADDPQPDGALDIPDLDADLLEIFVQEATDILDSADGSMASLRDSPGDAKLVVALQRDLHTLKGGARMAGLVPIGDLGHSMESLLEVIAAGRRECDPQVIEALEHGFDGLHQLVQRVAQQRAIAMPVHSIARLQALITGPVTDAAAAETAPEPQTKATPVPHRAPPVPLPHAPVEPRSAQELIRVRSDLLDSLVNYAGEVSIYRSRLEEQVSTFRFNLVEFEQTVSRLRGQLRQMEIETEAQIIARYQREHQDAASSSFDPLELDRFSQLQQYSRGLSESVSDLVSIQNLLDDITRQSETLLLQQSRVSSDLQEGLMRTRMVPFDSLVPTLRRTLRQAAKDTGKRAQMKVEGAQGEMDRNLLERMKAPFEHMLRNAMAHGIEDPQQRLAVGKPLDGTVRIQVGRDATEVVIAVSDDGRGIDREAVRAKAIERGLMTPDAVLSDRDLYAFMLETGFSTAAEITQLAGRGVGLDVVHSEIKQLGGSLAIDSELGQGTTFIIRLPFTLAVTQAILIRVGEHVFAIPMTSVQGVARIGGDDLQRRLGDPDASYEYAGEEYDLHELATLLSLSVTHLADEPQVPLLMIRTGDQRAAVRIDSVVGSREIVVKSVGPQISSVPGVFGATIMGDGSVVMILDLAPLVRRSNALRERVADGIVEPPIRAVAAAEAERRRRPLVMVVDDSITMRKVTTRVLERNDLDVVTAKDGLDAVEKLQEHIPDVMLLDIEMPRMDGYELATYMRNDARLVGVPIVMVTSRTGEKHRQRALEVGVEHYLGKPYQEADLLQHVNELLKASRV